MYDAILLPTDGSPGAAAAIDHAIHLAKQNAAVLHAVHVLEPSHTGAGTSDDESGAEGVDVPAILDPIFEAASGAGVDIVDSVIRGPTQEELLEYVRDNDIDLIVMGTQGKSGISRVLLGSTAEAIIRNAPIPVMTVRDRGD